ncbi:MAG TPA: hypothetical protein VN887_12095 [Candidatus Angelobacter sp.]|nr:hypothetical protein [Candidatus Angelobacter sp.]
MIKAIVPTGVDGSLEEFTIHCFADKCWRLISDRCALVLKPVCDSLARPMDGWPVFERLAVWPVYWGLPDCLTADHPGAVEELRLKHRQAGRARRSGRLRWETWLKEFGRWELWHRYRTAELERVWLNSRTGPGFRLLLLAGTRSGEHHVSRAVLSAIHFRADFQHGKDITTAYLSSCAKQPLHVSEARLLPAFVSNQEKLTTQKELSRGWTNKEYSLVRLPREDGDFGFVNIPLALRRILKVLDEEPGRTLDGATLHKRVVELIGGFAKDYRVSKSMKSKKAGRLLEAGIIKVSGDRKARIYQLSPPIV